MAELVDAADSKSAVGNNVGVRFSPEAPISLALKSSDLGAFLCLRHRLYAAYSPAHHFNQSLLGLIRLNSILLSHIAVTD